MAQVIVSSAGTSGPRGNSVLTGTGAPASTLGIDGDYYINTASYPASLVFYGPRANGAWPSSGVTVTGVNGALLAANNLSDLQSAATSRTNLGLGGAATLNVGTSAGTVAAGNDSRITGALQAANNLSDVASTTTARTNLGLAAIVTAKSNLTATTAPTTGSDGTQGYSVGSIWVNTSTNLGYLCTNASTGAAVWTPLLPVGTSANTVAAGNDSRFGQINGVTVSGTPTAGQVPFATGSTTAAWTSIGVPLKSGWYYPLDGGGGNRTMTYNLLWLWPFDCQRSITISKLACNVTTAGSSGTTIRLGVYASDGAGGIGNLIVDGGTVAGDTTGVKTITLSQAAGPDRLWFGAVWQGTNSTAPALQAYSKAMPYIGWSSFVQFPSIVAYQYTGITGALPASLGTPTGNENNNAPAIQFAPA